jgi:hypothetical protein
LWGEGDKRGTVALDNGRVLDVNDIQHAVRLGHEWLVNHNFQRALDEITEVSEILACGCCKKVVGWAIEKGEKYTCTLASRLAAAAMCEALGGGPEDPVADICAAVVIISCERVLKLITEASSSDEKICKLLNMCPDTESPADKRIPTYI